MLKTILVLLLTMSVAGRGRLLAASSESVLWSFGGAGDGTEPFASLIEVGGHFYGTTAFGGANSAGAVFELTPPAASQTQWSETVVWSFGGIGDGAIPEAGLIEVHGKLYGTTNRGGVNDAGTVVELTPPAPGKTQWDESVLWSFGYGNDGQFPAAGLIEVKGKLYGTTVEGGPNRGLGSDGTVFELTPPALGETQWSETVLWDFGGVGDCESPLGLIEVGGKLYGIANSGGANYEGAVFELTPPLLGQPQWSESVLWSFGGVGDGAYPAAGLIEVGGHLFGTTTFGGTFGFVGGSAFELTPPAPGQTQWSEKVTWNFGGPGDGVSPYSGVIEVGNKLYGTAGGGTDGVGTVFELTPPVLGQTQWSESVLTSFNTTDGYGPAAGLIESGGRLYGTTVKGGVSGAGTVFEVVP